ncbi:MAG TPA: ABC transporter permease [Ruminiclostridium sp.]
MKKSSITGWKDVFTFTLIQTLKNKTFIISTVILLVLSMVSMPIISMITSGARSDAKGPSPVGKVYIYNETTLTNMDFQELNKDKNMSHIVFEATGEDYKVVEKRIKDNENNSIILTIKENEGNYSLNFIKASKGPINDSSLQLLQNSVATQFETIKMKALGIKDEQLAMIHAEVKTKVSMADISGAEIVKEDTSISGSEYWFIYGLLFIVLMVNIMASTQIASSIVTEKSTRVIEYLLTSVKPLALMVGKIMAMLIAVLLQLLSFVIILAISNKVSKALSTGNGESILSQYLPKNIFQNLNIINIVFCIILIILGMIFYATLAGLTGATVSRIEEIQEGLMLFTFTNIIGAYIGIGAASVLMAKGINGFVIFSFLFPLSSPFILPGAILVGKVSLLIAAAAIILQVLFIIFLFIFVSKVFETLILHNGNKIKIKELIKLSKKV